MELYPSERAAERAERAEKIKKPLRDRAASVGRPHYITQQISNGVLVPEFVQTYYKHIRNSSRRRSLKLRIPFLAEDIESWSYELFYSHRKDERIPVDLVAEADNPSGFVTSVVGNAALKTLNFHLMLGESPIEIDNAERENSDGDDIGGMDFAAGEPDPSFDEIFDDFPMSEIERGVLDAHRGGKTYEEIGAEIGESDSSVFRILDKLKQRMRECNLPRPTQRRWNGRAVYNTNPSRLLDRKQSIDDWWTPALVDFPVIPQIPDVGVPIITSWQDNRTKHEWKHKEITVEIIRRFKTYTLKRPIQYGDLIPYGRKFLCRRVTVKDERKSANHAEVWRVSDAIDNCTTLNELLSKIQELADVVDVGTFNGEFGKTNKQNTPIHNSGDVVITLMDKDESLGYKFTLRSAAKRLGIRPKDLKARLDAGETVECDGDGVRHEFRLVDGELKTQTFVEAK